MMDLSFVIAFQKQQNVTLLSKSGGRYNQDGEWVDEATTETAITAAIQPATGNKLLDLPEGERSEAEFFLWTKTPLVVDDLIVYNGDRHRIIFVWVRPDGGFTRAVVGRTT